MDKLAEVFEYSLFSEERQCQDNGNFTAYGIKCVGQTPEQNSIKCANISSCPQTVQVLLDRLNRNRVPPAHFDEIVEDYLTELFG